MTTPAPPPHDAPDPADAPDVTVVGAGLAGLVTAVRIAAADREGGGAHRVLLLEAGGEPGGRARSTVHAGHPLNLGPRALYRDTERQLKELGVRVTGGAPDLARAVALRDGSLHPGYAAPGPLLRTGLLSWRERLAVARLLALTRPDRRLADRDGAQWLAERLPTERARQAAFAVLRVSAYAGRPEMIAADALAEHFAQARRGVRYVDGGWGGVVSALLERARALGVRLRTGARVVAVEGGELPLVRLADGSQIRSRSVVVAGPGPRTAAGLLDRPQLAAHAGRPLHTACLDLVLARLPDPRCRLVYGVDEPVYLSASAPTPGPTPDAPAPASAGPDRSPPPGGAVVHAARYDDGGPSAPGQARAQLYALLDRCQPGWRDVLVHERFLPRITTMSAVPGAASGGLGGRPGVRVPGRPGVFLAGDWVGPEGLLANASVLSAVRAADGALALLTPGREAAPVPADLPG